MPTNADFSRDSWPAKSLHRNNLFVCKPIFMIFASLRRAFSALQNNVSFVQLWRHLQERCRFEGLHPPRWTGSAASGAIIRIQTSHLNNFFVCEPIFNIKYGFSCAERALQNGGLRLFIACRQGRGIRPHFASGISPHAESARPNLLWWDSGIRPNATPCYR